MRTILSLKKKISRFSCQKKKPLVGPENRHLKFFACIAFPTTGTNVTRLMVLLNQTAQYLHGRGVGFEVENHISTGQTVPGLPDPLHPGQAINFNWITYYLDSWIVSRPHTVQIYALDDPAPTYGSKNFTASLDFINLMTASNHSVIWYPETNYW